MSNSIFSLDGKTAIVTGGKQGIGKAIALALAQAGADVAVCGRILEDGKLKAVADEIARRRARQKLESLTSGRPDGQLGTLIDS